MVSALVPGASGPGSRRGHCVVFLGKILTSHSASLHPGEYKWKPANCWGNLTSCGGMTCDGLTSRPGGVEILNRFMLPAETGSVGRSVGSEASF